jgi:hypothetical protein
METSETSILPRGAEEWIASQRGFLARIFHALEVAQASQGKEAALSRKSSGQLTLFDLGLSSLRTRQESEREEDISSSLNSWRVDIPGETDALPHLMLARHTREKGGSALLPTVTKSDGEGGPGTSKKRTGGMNLRTAMTMLPTICATDFKGPYSAEGYQKQMQHRSKPLRDTLAHTTGHRLTSAFAEWWMGWPLRWTATRRGKESKPVATGKCRSRRHLRI